MEISSIKKIQNIGTFANFITGGSCRFEKLTFIYGFNTFGKTTLTDVFQSLKENDPDIINKRKTIPIQPGDPRVILSVKDQSETDLKFENNAWDKNTVFTNLEIFGTEFIHKNLFTGLSIERENRENLTHFILGEQGVKIAEEIESKKRELGEKRRELKTKIPNFVKNKTETEIKNFLDYSIEGLEKDKIENTLSQKKIELQKEQERLKEPQKILQLQEPNKVEPQIFTIVDDIKAANAVLQKEYQGIKDDVLSKIKKHLANNFLAEGDAENWIKAGSDYCKDKRDGNCPFCGQGLKGAQDLINAYESYFNKAYNDFISEIKRDLESGKEKIENNIFTQKTVFQTTLSKANQYKELIGDINFQSELADLQSNIELLHEDYLSAEKNDVLSFLKNKSDEKNKCPYKKVDPIDFTGMEKKLAIHGGIIASIMGNIDKIIEKIKLFKQQYENLETIQKGIELLDGQITELDYQKERISLNGECDSYKQLQQNNGLLELRIVELDSQLRTNQSRYLEDYFSQINDLFKKLGSRDFTLEKEEDRSGHLPVYSLKIKFKGVAILNNQLPTIFSESDRRALALAIFWAKINLKSEIDSAKTIIILDDPVASFDDNRITRSINIFKETAKKVSQMIILTHYLSFIRRFCEIKDSPELTVKFLEINQNSTTSFLNSCDRGKFEMSKYEEVFVKIYGFINKLHAESIKADLRPFLENLYIPTVFAKQIHDKNVDCTTLDKKIDGIFDDNEKARAKFHEFRITLNPDSHLFTTNNDEDVRGFAIEMLDYLYSLDFV